MTYPSVKTIKSIEWLDKVGDPTAIAKQIRKVMEFWQCDPLIDYAIDTLELNLPNHVYRYNLVSLQLWVIDNILQCHGVEGIANHSGSVHLEYCNTGETYANTVAYDHRKNKFVVTSYGDWIERNDPNGSKY